MDLLPPPTKEREREIVQHGGRECFDHSLESLILQQISDAMVHGDGEYASSFPD